MALIPNWRASWRMASVRIAALAVLFSALPADQQAALLQLVGIGPERLPGLLGLAGNLGSGVIQLLFVLAVSLMIAAQPTAYREVAVLLAPALNRALRGEKVQRVLSAANTNVMALYLWHMVPVVIVATEEALAAS